MILLKKSFVVVPAKAGTQSSQFFLDPGFRRETEWRYYVRKKAGESICEETDKASMARNYLR